MAHELFDNTLIEKRIDNFLTTSVDLQAYMTVDNSLTERPGMSKKIVRYSATGDVQDLAMGEGNTEFIEASQSDVTYTVGTSQGAYKIYDEEAMEDPMVEETCAKRLSESLINKFVEKAIKEYAKAELIVGESALSEIDFDSFVDALAKLPAEEEVTYFGLLNAKTLAAIRKKLKDDLKYSEGYVRTGYVGTVAGVPLTVSQAVPDNCIFIASNQAVTLFNKKGVEIETDRDPDTRLTITYGRKVNVVALTDATRCVAIMVKIAAPVITTASLTAGDDVEFKGTCVAGAAIEVLKGGVKVGNATVVGTDWTYTIATAAEDEVYSARAKKEFYAPADSATSLTVAAAG